MDDYQESPKATLAIGGVGGLGGHHLRQPGQLSGERGRVGLGGMFGLGQPDRLGGRGQGVAVQHVALEGDV
ncbi:hypothetical protein AB0J28_11575 [Streptosporangium canum]|uniref:hypothetical protein n=1 Tax=Streptosporangium canum TaxID=324952 RepID=UPI00342F36EE